PKPRGKRCGSAWPCEPLKPMPGENSEVLKTFTDPAWADGSGVRLVASAVKRSLGVTLVLNVTENEAPPPLVVALVAPRKVWPSDGRDSGSGLLAKNSMRNVVFGSLGVVSVPEILTPPTTRMTELRMGKSWRLLGSLGVPWPLESLAVKPSSLGKRKPLV